MYLFIKRLFDLLCGLIGLIILIPLTLFVKVAFLISGDTGHIFYRQERVGKGGKIIKILKYRSMVQNADVVLVELLRNEHYREEWERNQKFIDDPRVTGIGRFLRKSSLDELPQLINVLSGEMSIVGPRPLVKGELEAHGGKPIYLTVKPGITGWWASHGRSDIEYGQRLALEYYYIENQSLKLDIICIYKTIIAVLNCKGAK